MAKHCTVCNQDYADDLAACPHCAAAKKTHLAQRSEERTTQLADVNAAAPAPSDSAIDFGPAASKPATGDAGGEPVSGASAVAWAALVEEPSAEQVKIDSPSDADLLARAAAEPAPPAPAGPPEERVGELAAEEPATEATDAGAGAEVVELSSSPPQPVEKPSDSAVDLGATPPAEVSEEAVLDAAGVSDESSAVDLGAPPVESSEALSAEEAGEVVKVPDGSGIDLEGLPVPAASASDLHPASESSVDLGSHAEMAPPTPSEEGSAATAGSGIDVGPPGEAAAAGSGIDVGPPGEAASGEEPAVSEKEVDDLLAGLEKTPAEGELAGVAAEEAAEIAEGQEAIAAAEAEEEAAEAEEEAAEAEAKQEEKPAKPIKPRSRIPALVGGMFLGMLIGAGGLFGVQALMGPGQKEKAPVRAAGPTTPQVTFDSLKAMVSNGDWEGAKKAGIDTVPANNPDQLAARGEYRMGEYLAKAGNKINRQDPALQPALQDLQKAAEQKDPDAAYDLALLKELAGDLAGARAAYDKGAKDFANDPVQKQRFESAVSRVDWKASLKGAGAAVVPLPERGEDRAVLALLLIGLQQLSAPPSAQPGQQPAPPAQTEDKEAGFEFWQAAKLARQGKFSDAIRAIDQARKLHDQRRFKRLRKAQNPLSDPAEDIFLRCCDELKVYWQLENRLRDGRYLTDKNTPPEALQALFQKAEAGTATVEDLKAQLVAAKVIGANDNVSKGLARLISEKKAADAKVADLTPKFQKATAENTKLAGELKAAKKTIEQRDASLTSAKEQMAKGKTANDELNATLTKIKNELAQAKLLGPKGKANVGEAVKKAVDIAKIKDPQGMIGRQRDEIAQLSASLKERWRPEEMLPLWLLLLDENRHRSELTSQATKDVERVKMDPRATAAQKGEAEVVLGLALRNAEQFSKAKTVLEAARGTVDKGEWLVRADAALKEVSNPAAYFTRRATDLYDHGRMEAALAVLERAMTVLPAKEHGKLLAQRSLIELDAARSKAKGTLPPTGPLLIAARKHANEAVKAGLAEGHYAAGRVAEELGQVDAAIQSYRKALAAHGDKLDAEGGRYRMALARVLLLPREARPGQPAAPARATQKLGWRNRALYPARHFEDRKSLVFMLTLGLQAPLLPGEEPGQEEAEKLADEVLKAKPGTVPFNVLAQALAVKGRWNEALQTYVEGIRPMLPREYGNGLVYLIRNDPRLKRPDSLRTPNPLEAEKHFAAGLNFYFDRDYANAEKEFLLTVENDSQDARFFYFLGLSRLAQNRRRDAYADFNQAAMLERLNRPSPSAVSESLERIQGPTRRIVNEVRQRPEPSQRPER